jgi:hypothetical protein
MTYRVLQKFQARYRLRFFEAQSFLVDANALRAPRSSGVCCFVGNLRVMRFSFFAADRSSDVRYWEKRTSQRQGNIDVNDPDFRAVPFSVPVLFAGPIAFRHSAPKLQIIQGYIHTDECATLKQSFFDHRDAASIPIRSSEAVLACFRAKWLVLKTEVAIWVYRCAWARLSKRS